MYQSLRNLFFTLVLLVPGLAWGQSILFVTDEDPGSLNAGDQALYSRLTGQGYSVTVRGSSAQPASTGDAAGKDLVLISSSINSGAIGTMFRDVTQPVIVCESFLFDDMEMTGGGSSQYGDDSGQDRLEITLATHAIAQSLSGTVTLNTQNEIYRWGKPLSSAAKIARIHGSSDEYAVFCYDAGDQLDGMVAPGIRIGFFLHNLTAASLNNAGWTLFDNAVNYALGGTVSNPSSTRITDDLVVLYTFQEGAGILVNDVSGYGTPLNLQIQNPNDATWLPNGGLVLDGNNIIKSTVAATKIRTAATATNAITLEAWVKPVDVHQDGPARIITYSVDASDRNFTLGQEDDEYVARLRTNSGTTQNGFPEFFTDPLVNVNAPQHVVYTRDASGQEKWYIDGTVVDSDHRSGNFTNWDQSYFFALGNELTMNRKWNGTFYLAAVYAKALNPNEVALNYQAGPQAGTPGPVACNATGQLLYERWEGISGSNLSSLLSDPDYPANPDVSQVITTLFEAPTNVTDNYGARLSGYLCAPATGAYTFWVAGDDETQLWLSTDADPANKVKIAFHTSWTSSQQWDKFTTQESAPVNLVAGQTYYIEALVKEGGGGDNLAVGWQLPNGTLERPIPASYFSDTYNGGGTPPPPPGPAVAIDSCTIYNFDGSDNRWVWMKDAGTQVVTKYTWDGEPGKIVFYSDGTAHIDGTVVAVNNPNQKWVMDVWFHSERNWNQWQALGRDYKVDTWVENPEVGHANHPYWTFYEMDDTRSTFVGQGSFAGQTLNLSHRPASYYYGFQFGLGANDMNGFYGFSGWWSYTGSQSGEGDFNANLRCSDLTPPSAFSPEDWYYECADDVEVEIVGVGAFGQTSTTLTLTDVASIDSIIVEAVSKNGTPKTDVTFVGSNGQTVVALARQVAKTPNGNSNSTVRTYRAVLGASETVTLTDVNPSTTWSLVAYVFRSGRQANRTSSATLIETYFYRGGQTYALPLPTSDNPRDVTFYIPITELNVDSRIGGIRVTAGGVTDSITVQHPNLGTSLNITPITLHNVPGNVDEVVVSINSPNSNGDSFVAGGYVEVSSDCDYCGFADGGQISGDQFACGPFDPVAITSLSLADGNRPGLEYDWRYTFDLNLDLSEWISEGGADPLSYDPDPITEPIWVVRLSRRPGCGPADWVASDTVFLDPRPAPVARFTPPAGVCAGVPADFTALGNTPGTVIQYVWTFAQGSPANQGGSSATTTWNQPGTYNVTLSVYRNGCNATVTQPVSIDDCSICDNISGGGAITGGAASCFVPFDPGPITNKNLPTTGSGALEFVWISTTDPTLPQNQWTMIPGSNSPDYDPGPLTETTYFQRCVRRAGCSSFLESNVITIEIVEGAHNLCVPGEIASQNWSISLDLNEGTTSGEYYLSPDDRKFITYTDGTAKLEGLLIHRENSNRRWYATLWFKELRDWGQWSHLGGTYLPGPQGSDHPAWDYYVLDATQSTLEGRQKFKGKTLTLAPTGPTSGFQLGFGANTVDAEYGLAGDFAYSGSYTGNGNLRLNLSECQTGCTPTPRIATRVLLQGAYQPSTGEMTTSLNAGGMLPLNQPFNVWPYFYAGTESVGAIPSPDITDWLLIELRDADNPATILSRRAVFVKKNGELADLDGISLPQLDVDPNASYYLAIISRNHLDVMSAVAQDRMGRVYWHNFLADDTQAYLEPGLTNSPMIEVQPGVYALMSGDANRDGVINATDFNVVAYFFFQFGYTMGDVTCDGVVNATDYLNVVFNYFKFSHLAR